MVRSAFVPRLSLTEMEEGAERLPGEPRLDALVLDHARERVAVLRLAPRAAEGNIFLGDGYNDAPRPDAETCLSEIDQAAFSPAWL